MSQKSSTETIELLKELRNSIDLVLSLPEECFKDTTEEEETKLKNTQGGENLFEIGNFLVKRRFPKEPK